MVFDTWEWDGAQRTWTQLAMQDATSPQYLYPCMAYDIARDRFVLAGEDFANSRVDVSEWDAQAAHWNHVDVTGASPPYRQECNLAYAGNGQTILYGGQSDDAAADVLQDQWFFDGTQWTQAMPTTTPGTREFSTQIYDLLRDQVWLFGGDHGSAPVDELWQWDGTDWSQLAMTGPLGDGPAVAHNTYFDRLVAFGDCKTQTVWEWDGATWASFDSLSPSPAARCYGTMVYDVARDELVMYGGQIFDAATSSTRSFHDSWIYTLQ